VDTDASDARDNPCVLTVDSRLVALDAKMTIDETHCFGTRELRELRDLDEKIRWK